MKILCLKVSCHIPSIVLCTKILKKNNHEAHSRQMKAMMNHVPPTHLSHNTTKNKKFRLTARQAS